MPINPLSETVFTEIINAYVSGEERRPSDAAIRELAELAGKTEQAVRNRYRAAHAAAGGAGDPFGLVSPEIFDEP